MLLDITRWITLMMRRHTNSLATMLYGSALALLQWQYYVFIRIKISHMSVYINTPFGILLKNKTLASTNNSHYRDSFQPTIAFGKLVLCDLAHFCVFFFSLFFFISLPLFLSFVRFFLYTYIYFLFKLFAFILPRIRCQWGCYHTMIDYKA